MMDEANLRCFYCFLCWFYMLFVNCVNNSPSIFLCVLSYGLGNMFPKFHDPLSPICYTCHFLHIEPFCVQRMWPGTFLFYSIATWLVIIFYNNQMAAIHMILAFFNNVYSLSALFLFSLFCKIFQKPGDCLCKEGYAGRSCDSCAVGYYGFPNCRQCRCDVAGSKNPENCDRRCDCKVSSMWYCGIEK